MKKTIISIISAMALAVSAMPLNVTAEETNNDKILAMLESGELPTDADMDGEFDLADTYAVLMYYAICMETPEHTYVNSDEISEEVFNNVRDNFDYDNDGVVDTYDASLLLNYYYSDSVLGDVDGDSTVTASDASLVLKYYAGCMIGNVFDYEIETNMRYLGDVNGDNIINASDASDILYIYSEAMTTISD